MSKKILRNFIKGALLEAKSPEAPKDASAGEYLFAPDREFFGVPHEENTQEEERVFRALIKHYMDSAKLDQGTANTLLSWLEKGWYSNILKPPTSTLVYRGHHSIPEKH